MRNRNRKKRKIPSWSRGWARERGRAGQRRHLQEKAKENVNEVGEGLYVEFNEPPGRGRKDQRAYGNHGQSAQVSASQPWGKRERE